MTGVKFKCNDLRTQDYMFFTIHSESWSVYLSHITGLMPFKLCNFVVSLPDLFKIYMGHPGKKGDISINAVFEKYQLKEQYINYIEIV